MRAYIADLQDSSKSVAQPWPTGDSAYDKRIIGAMFPYSMPLLPQAARTLLLALPLTLALGACELSDEVADEVVVNPGGKTDSFGIEEGSPTSVGLLNFVNRVHPYYLAQKVGLDLQTADLIAQERELYDGNLETTPGFRTLSELVAVDGVDGTAFEKLLDYALANGWIEEDAIVESWSPALIKKKYAVSEHTLAVLYDNDETNEDHLRIYDRDLLDAQNWEVTRDFEVPRSARAIALSGETLAIAFLGSSGFAPKLWIHSRNQGGSNNWGLVQVLTIETADDSHSPLSPNGPQHGLVITQDRVTLRIAGHLYIVDRATDGAEGWAQQTWAGRKSIYIGNATQFQLQSDTIVYQVAGTRNTRILERNDGGVDFWGETEVLIGNKNTWGKTVSTRFQLDGNMLYVQDARRPRTLRTFRRLGGTNSWDEQARVEVTGDSSWLSFAVRGDFLTTTDGLTIRTYQRADASSEWLPSQNYVQSLPTYDTRYINLSPVLTLEQDNLFLSINRIVDSGSYTVFAFQRD